MVYAKSNKVTVVGRPQKLIDWEVADKLLMAGATGREVASHFDLHPNNFYTRCEQEKGMCFTDYKTSKRDKGLCSLRVVQHHQALQGNTQLLIHLGKCYLDQLEKSEIAAPATVVNIISYKDSKVEDVKNEEKTVDQERSPESSQEGL